MSSAGDSAIPTSISPSQEPPGAHEQAGVPQRAWLRQVRPDRSRKKAGRARSFYPARYLLLVGGPGFAWLALFIALAIYALFAVAMGSLDPLLMQPQPAWSPLHWAFGAFGQSFSGLVPGGAFWGVVGRSVTYIGLAAAGCVVIGYPVAYYVALHAKRSKPFLLVLLVIPFLVSYMLRMLAWVGLLAPDGYVNSILRSLHVVTGPSGWLDGHASTVVLALIYGWVPYFILPLYASLERLDRRYLEAAADLGASRVATFVRVTLPLSKQGILAGLVLVALPMCGDYFTNQLVSGTDGTTMIGNLIGGYVNSDQLQLLGAALASSVLLLLAVLLTYYVRVTARATLEAVR